MLDAVLRRRLAPALDRVGRALAPHLHPDAITLVGFVVGLAAVPALALGAFEAALALILANRLADGLDGAVARARAGQGGGGGDFGGYLDIVCDFIVYSAWVLGFALSDPGARALPAAFLIFSFVGTGTSFLAFAILAAKRGVSTTARGRKAFYHLGGLTEGTETIALFVAACLWPGWFPLLAWGFGAACWLTTLGRVLEARRVFGDPSVL